jgi:protein-S-isoprenylcysteine O-methyltransferase Ste14
MTVKRNNLGVGLKWALPTTVYFVGGVIAHLATYPRFVISQVSLAPCLIFGILLVTAGVSAYLAALMSLRRGLRSNALVTRGLYAIVRHPLYASSIFAIIPGVVLAFRSWLLLPMPVVAYVACRLVLQAEDDDLQARYGEQFSQYRQSTNALFPTQPPWLRCRIDGPKGKD